MTLKFRGSQVQTFSSEQKAKLDLLAKEVAELKERFKPIQDRSMALRGLLEGLRNEAFSNMCVESIRLDGAKNGLEDIHNARGLDQALELLLNLGAELPKTKAGDSA